MTAPLITPSYRHITTGVADPEEIAQLESILAQQQDLIGQLKRYLMYGLTLYSALPVVMCRYEGVMRTRH